MPHEVNIIDLLLHRHYTFFYRAYTPNISKTKPSKCTSIYLHSHVCYAASSSIVISRSGAFYIYLQIIPRLRQPHSTSPHTLLADRHNARAVL